MPEKIIDKLHSGEAIKVGSAVEFGGKISVSVYENYVFLDKLSWDNFNESTHLIEQVEKYSNPKSFVRNYHK